ncbi:MAG: hypothetical protein ACLS8H_07380 [Ruminococcus sp.]
MLLPTVLQRTRFLLPYQNAATQTIAGNAVHPEMLVLQLLKTLYNIFSKSSSGIFLKTIKIAQNKRKFPVKCCGKRLCRSAHCCNSCTNRGLSVMSAHNLLIFHTGKFFVKYRKNSFQCGKNMV